MSREKTNGEDLGQNDAKLGDFLTYASVLLRAQSRKVVAEALVVATADLIPELNFSGLLLSNETGTAYSLVAYRDERLLRADEASELLEQLNIEQFLQNEPSRALRVETLAEPAKSQLMAQLLHIAPTSTPSRQFGYLLGSTRNELSSGGSQYLKALSQLAGIAFDNASRFDDLKEAAHDMSLVNEMAGSLAASLNGEELFNSFIIGLYDIIALERANLILLPPLSQTYNMPFSWDGPPGHTRRIYLKDLPLAGSPFGAAVDGQEIIVEQWQITTEDSLQNETNVFSPIFKSQMIIPLIAKRQIVGALAVGSREAGAYQEDQLRRSLLEKLAALFALALLNSRLYEEKQLSAEFDSRIGVYNHDFFDRELVTQMHKARRNDYRLGLMMIDMDNLKTVNDKYGHLAGDAALRHIATNIGRTVRTTDVVARYGGDEFGVLLPGCTQMGLEVVAEKTRQAVRNTPLVLETGEQVTLTVSIGAILCPEDVINPREVIQQVDSAMYVAKISRDQVRIGPNAVLSNLSEQDLRQNDSMESLVEADNLPPPTDEEYERTLLALGSSSTSVEGRIIHELTERLAQARATTNEATERIKQLEEGVVRTLHLGAELIERREPNLQGGAARLARLMRLFGQEVGMTAQELDGLEAAAWLANLGRIALPEAVLNRPGPLTAYEWRRMRQMPLEVIKMLKPMEDLLPPNTLPALLAQRERIDGTGYPRRLAGEEISKSARLLSIGSSLVAMTQARAFRERLDRATCREQLERGAGRAWDTDLINTLLALLDTTALNFLDFA